jgi:hypothetical protein
MSCYIYIYTTPPQSDNAPRKQEKKVKKKSGGGWPNVKIDLSGQLFT